MWKKWRNFEFYLDRREYSPITVVGTLGGLGIQVIFERSDGIWISNIHRDWIPQFCARYWDSFWSYRCSSIIYMCKTEPFYVILWYTLLRKKKLIFFNLETTDMMRDASFSCKMLLKLINFKSFNRKVTWSRFKYFPLLATFVAKFIHFCTLYTFVLAVFYCICHILNYNSLDERR